MQSRAQLSHALPCHTLMLGVDVAYTCLDRLTKFRLPVTVHLGMPCPLPAGVTYATPLNAMPNRLSTVR